ncbi:MAG: rhodanese-like domain-containing protein [Chloroflexota bacterium]|nr:rhodanese-like domain-containing protein [Chloroflexota bacterium]
MFKSIFGAGSTPAYQNVSAQEAHQMINSNRAPFVIDVREPDEFKGGHIQGAKLLPLSELPNRLNDVPKDQTILVVCRSGARSSSAARFLAGAGYQVINMRGGMTDWEIARLPIKR